MTDCNGDTIAFAYDADDRLTSVDNQGTPGAPNVALSFAYDSRDNRTLLSDNLGGQIAYQYDLANRVANETLIVAGVDARPSVTLGYDAGGRLTDLSRVDAGASGGGGVEVATSLVYDAASRLTGMTHQADAETLAEYGFTWDAAGQIAWYLGDHLGTIRDLADAGGAVIDHIAYDSFGGVLSESDPSVGDRFKFTDRELDAETGLYYYRARYYDPAAGRLVSEDPIRRH